MSSAAEPMFDEALSADKIVPRVVHVLPKGGVPDLVLSPEDSPVQRSFVADLILSYAFDQPTCFTMVAERDLTQLGLDEQGVHDIALVNLRRTISPPQAHQVSEGVFMLTCGGDMEATILLLDEVWQQTEGMVLGELVVAVPARDVVFFTGTENREGLAFMRSKVSEILEVGDHTLTRSFLVRNGSAWVVYEGFGG